MDMTTWKTLHRQLEAKERRQTEALATTTQQLDDIRALLKKATPGK